MINENISTTHACNAALYAEPPIKPNINFNYTLNDLIELEKSNCNLETNFKSFIIQAINHCGIQIGDTEALKFLKMAKGFQEGFRYPRVSGLIDSTRVTFRVVPEHWKENHNLLTNFVLYGNDIIIDNTKVASLSAIFTGSSVHNLAYETENGQKEKVLCLNPLQHCSQYCRFCFKGIRAMNQDAKAGLVNLSPKEMMEYLKKEFSAIEYKSLTEVAILTARFPNSQKLLHYCYEVYEGIKEISEGDFDPINNNDQRMKISTHLLESLEDMQRAKQLGFNRYIYPIEIFNDSLRKKYMSSPHYGTGKNKGDCSFTTVKNVLIDAIDLYGVSNVEPVIIIGIDNYQDTMQGLLDLKSIGCKILTYSVFRVYDSDQMEMYNMSFEEILKVLEYIKLNFNDSFYQNVTEKQVNFHKKYIIV